MTDMFRSPNTRALAERDRCLAPPHRQFHGVAADGCAESDPRAGLPSEPDRHVALVVSLPLLSGALLRIVAGWSSDWYGAKPTGTVILVGELVVTLWGWLGVHSYHELLLVATLLGIGGASFAVTLADWRAVRIQPPTRIRVGIVASGNVGTVLILFLAPRFAVAADGTTSFGWMTLPIVAAWRSLLLSRAVRSTEPATPARSHWWHNVAVMIRQPNSYWLCGLYAVTFGGFVGFCSILPLFFHEQYHVDGITAGSIAALCGLVGSLIRPLGGYVADRVRAVCARLIIVAPYRGDRCGVGEFPMPIAVAMMVVATGAMGFGNGVIFQLVSEWFPKQIGLASGIVGAAGGIGGFLLPIWLGTLKGFTGSYDLGLWVFAVAVFAWGTVIVAFGLAD